MDVAVSGCKPATNAAEVGAFVKCVSSNELIAQDVTARSLTDQNSVEEVKDPRELAAFLEENADDVKRLPAGHTRGHVGVNGDGQYLELLLTVKDGKVRRRVRGRRGRVNAGNRFAR